MNKKDLKENMDHIERRLQRQRSNERKTKSFKSFHKSFKNMRPEDFLSVDPEEWDEFET